MENLIELDELRDSVRRVLDDLADRQSMLRDPSAVPQLNATLWKTLTELGWLGLAVPEAHGGLGQPFTALAILYQEFGRSLLASSFASAAIGLDMLSTDGASEQAGPLIAAGIAGEAIVVAAATGIGTLDVRSSESGFVLDGSYGCVPGAGAATHLLVPIEQPEVAIALVELPQSGVTVTARPSWDITQLAFDIRFTEVAIQADSIVLRGPAAADALTRMGTHLDLALACDAVGGADRIFCETLEYMATRRQFNRAIASFQALKHRCADLKTAMEGSRALVEASCAAYSHCKGEWRTMAACSRLYAGSVYRNVTEEAVQLHGGIGFTWEHPCHLFLKRARMNEVLGGSAEQRKDRVAPVLLAAARDRTGSLLSHRRNDA
ncbi:acyl-CoA dehydrogenase [Trinickia violacea]|uniref:Acyl-CoA dehydrogenase n=1 Tax=Trinickia violacea TaxID=2571746 RepID=A0A4P8IX96_9BURK|nr:acyl-CoA dehydrogenase [Trinickia violacea]